MKYEDVVFFFQGLQWANACANMQGLHVNLDPRTFIKTEGGWDFDFTDRETKMGPLAKWLLKKVDAEDNRAWCVATSFFDLVFGNGIV